MFSLASTLLFKIASPAFEKAYEKGCSIWDAKDELRKLRRSIQTIQVVLLDAEKKQDTSAAIKDWVKRVKDVLYDADDLFDEVSTDEMLKQHIIKEGKILKKVRASCSRLNPIVSRNSIANQVKAIRKMLLEISTDVAHYNFVKCPHEEPICSARQGEDPGSFVDSKEVFGRDEDKKAILKFLLHDQSNEVEDNLSVIAIVGIGGMGKTTLAQLVYNDEEVKKNFENRWFACISDTSDDKEVIGKVFQSICKKNYGDFTLSQLRTEIRESVEGKFVLLVLDDVWDNNRSKWIDRMGLLSGCAKGSKIIVTTRSLEVASVVGAKRSTHNLKGLSDDESWALFKRVAFTDHEWEKDSRRIDLGRRMVKNCANVPLAIKSIGSLLHAKATIQEWESIMKEQLTKVEESGRVPIISVLKLSYDHLHSNLKQCFAYCSLFPKDYVFDKQDLIYLWIAQGYIKSNSTGQTFEEVGHSYFMDLLRMSFFQEARYDAFGEINRCKMHDLIHDLAQNVATEESIMLTTSTTEIKGTPRHANVYCIAGDSSTNLIPLWNGNRLRSLFFRDEDSTCRLVLDQEFAKLKFLRALKLSGLGIENVPSSIGELKLLRYLDVSRNKFKRLPDSITKLLNLCLLNLSECGDLEALPIDLRKLINLRHLKIGYCFKLRYVPPGFKELTSLQHLDCFEVSETNKLGDLFGLKIRGQLNVLFKGDSDNAEWNGVECWQPLVNLQGLRIRYYKGMRIPHWANGRSANSPSLLLPNLTSLSLIECRRVMCLPPFRHLPNLKFLTLRNMDELEYVEEEEEEENGGKQNLTAVSDALFLPYLKRLQLSSLPKLKGWSRKVEAATTRKDDATTKGEEHSSSTSASVCAQLPSFPSLSTLEIHGCKELKYIPQCPSLRALDLEVVDAKVIPPLLSIHDHSSPSTTTSSTLERMKISYCDGLTSFPGQYLTSLRYLEMRFCDGMKRVELPPSHLNILEDLTIRGCFSLEMIMWEEEKRSVDWDSLNSLRKLFVSQIPSPESFLIRGRLPDCLLITNRSLVTPRPLLV